MTKKQVSTLLKAAVLLIVLFFILYVLPINCYYFLYEQNILDGMSFARPAEADPGIAYTIDILYNGETAASSSYYIQDRSVLDIDVDLASSVSGYHWTPFYKSFSVDFSTYIESATPGYKYILENEGTTLTIIETTPQDCLIYGDMVGTIHITVVGLCTPQKALELAKEQIVKDVQAYLVNYLNEHAEMQQISIE
jgi:hypothetical protein